MRGAIGFKEMAEASRDLDERLRTLQAAVNPLASQFDLLGIKSQASPIAARDNAREAFDAIVQGAREGIAAQEDIVRAFKALVDAERAAAADSSDLTKEQVEDQLALKPRSSASETRSRKRAKREKGSQSSQLKSKI